MTLSRAWRRGLEARRRARRRAGRGRTWRPDPFTHRGIELEIWLVLPAEDRVIFSADSDAMYSTALMGAGPSCGFTCPPLCDEHGWYELVPAGHEVRVRIRPRLLADRIDEPVA